MLYILNVVLSLSLNLGWSQVCQDSRNSLNGLGELTTPWNTKVYSLYSQHMDPSDQDTVQKWLTAQVPVSNFAQLARLILRKHNAILTQKRHELKVISELYRFKKIQWIGVELSPDELIQFSSQLTEQAQALKELLVEKGLSADEADDMALLIYDSGHYFVAHRPKNSEPLNLVALEEESAYSASLTQAARMTEARDEIANKSKILKIPSSTLSDFDKEITEILGENQVTPSKNQKKNQDKLVSRMPSSEGKQLIKQGFKAAQDFVVVSLGRDQKISEQIWKNAKTSGLFIYGRAHQPGVSESLLKLCRKKI